MADVDLTALRDATPRLVDLSNQVDGHGDCSEPLTNNRLAGLLAAADPAEETWREAFRTSVIEGRPQTT